MADAIPVDLVIGLLSSTIRLATPFLLAALGEVVAQRAGVLNMGLEGMMLMGAFASFAVAFVTDDLALGMISGVLAGAGMGLMLGLWSITLRANMVHTGVLITIFSQGAVGFLLRAMFGGNYIPARTSLQPVFFRGLSDIPFVGPVLFQQIPLVYFGIFMVLVVYLFLNRTTLGLSIRAVGENPRAADSLGLSVKFTRYVAIAFGGAMAGLAGSFLSVGYGTPFTEGVIAGRGWIAVALVYFGTWNPFLVLVGSLLFGGVDSLQLRLQVIGVAVPTDLLLMLPYLTTLAGVMLFAQRKVHAPRALTVPYDRSG